MFKQIKVDGIVYGVEIGNNLVRACGRNGAVLDYSMSDAKVIYSNLNEEVDGVPVVEYSRLWRAAQAGVRAFEKLFAFPVGRLMISRHNRARVRITRRVILAGYDVPEYEVTSESGAVSRIPAKEFEQHYDAILG